MHLYDYWESGNGYKVRMALHRLGTPFERSELDILEGATRTPEFLAKNPNGRIPFLVLDDGTGLAESNAIQWFLAEGTRLLPDDPLDRARVLQWMFFEQYSHEPFIAVPRFWAHVGLLDEKRDQLPEKYQRGHEALQVMENHLAEHDFFVTPAYSIADIALYAYTHVASEGGYDLAPDPAVRRWCERVASQPGHIPISKRGRVYRE